MARHGLLSSQPQFEAVLEQFNLCESSFRAESGRGVHDVSFEILLIVSKYWYGQILSLHIL